ncbi:MAG: peptidyl-prolyl cis-trans isomerase [Luteimonas sp.]
MLQALRDKTSGWIAVVIVAILAIPFAFFGMEQYLFQNSASYAARVEAPPAWWRSAPDVWPIRKLFWSVEEIEANEFRNEFERARQQQRQAEGDQFDALAFEAMENKRRVLERLVDQAAMRLYAATAGIAVGDGQVRREIEAIPGFQVEGRFDPQRYQLALQSQVPARTPQQFQELVREGLQQSLLPTQLAQSAFVTPAELERVLRLLGQRRDVSYVVLPAPAPDTGAISAEEIRDWYRTHARAFSAPETVTLEYVEVDGNALPIPAVADDAALRARYEQERARFVEPEQRLASHLLVRVEAGADPATQKAAEAEAARLAGQAREPGADFAALARAHSDDTGSRGAGGDLGWVAQGTMAPPFDEALFAMQPGEVRGPVKTDFGWHVIQLRETRSGRQVAFEDARATLAEEQAAADRDRVFNDLVGRLVDQVYRNPSTLAPAAREANLPVRRLGPFVRGQGAGIAANAAVERAAFSEALVQDGTVSDPIEIGPNRSVLIRVAEHVPSRALPLAEVRNQVVAAIRRDRATKAVEAAAEAMVARLRGGAALSELAAARNLSPQTLTNLPRGAPAPDETATEAYFEAPAPAAGKPSVGKAVLADGSQVVFAVTKVTPGDPTQATPQERQQLQQQLETFRGNEDENGFMQGLRQRMKVTVVEARL